MLLSKKMKDKLKCAIEHKVNKHVHKHFCNHVKKHGHKHVHKLFHIIHHTHHYGLHVGELIVVISLFLFSFIFASTTPLPNNKDFVYPIQKISTLECRTLYWEDMPENCKIDLPIIYGANYDKYKSFPGYMDFYTTLRGASYSDNWNVKVGAHAGVDIATARGTPLYSIGNGKVHFAGWKAGYGNMVRVKYLYKGEYIYVIYAHMDTIEVETGKTVTKGQRVGTVGNSGNVFGALGGYHVHFQIAKDIKGYPRYSYLNCPDLDKGHYRIIQDGLCRDQLLAAEYDPIAFLEGNIKLNIPIDEKIEQIITGEVINNISPANSSINLINTGIIETKPLVEVKPIDQNPIKADIQPILVVDQAIPQEIKNQDLFIDLAKLDDYAKHFFTQNDIRIETNLSGRTIKIGEEELITIYINKKNPIGPYIGILDIPFSLIATNTNVSLNYSSIKLISEGKAEIKVKGKIAGSTSIIINFGGTRIAKVSLNVN